MKQWLSNVVAKVKQLGKGRPALRSQQRPRLGIEALEHRELLAASAFDLSFGTGGQVAVNFNNISGRQAQSQAVAIQTDGKIVIAGDFATPSGTTDVGVVRLNTDGSYDSTFGSGGRTCFNYQGGIFGPNAFANAVAIDRQGNIVVAGYAVTTSGADYEIVARIIGSGPLAGSFDSTFGIGGRSCFNYQGGIFGPNAVANAVAIDQQGNIVLAGYAQATSGSYYETVARLNSSAGPSGGAGYFDSTFGSGGRTYFNYQGDGFGPNAVANAVAIDQQGRIVVAGFAANSGSNYATVARLNSFAGPSGGAGYFDSTFGIGGRSYFNYQGLSVSGVAFTPTAEATAVAIDQQDRIVVAVNIFGGPAGEYAGVARLNSSAGPGGGAGYFDSTFGTGGRSYFDFSSVPGIAEGADTFSVSIDPQDNIVVAAQVVNTGGTYSVGVARLLSGSQAGNFDKSFNGGGETAFSPNGVGAKGVSSLALANPAVATDGVGRIIVVDSNAASSIGVARLNTPLPLPYIGPFASVTLGTVGTTTTYFAQDTTCHFIWQQVGNGWQLLSPVSVYGIAQNFQSFQLGNVGGLNSLVALSTSGTLYLDVGSGLNPIANGGNVQKYEIGTLNGAGYLFALETNGQLECLTGGGWKLEASNVLDFNFESIGNTPYVLVTTSSGTLNLTQP